MGKDQAGGGHGRRRTGQGGPAQAKKDWAGALCTEFTLIVYKVKWI